MKKVLLILAVIIGSIILWNYAKPNEVHNAIEQTEVLKTVIPQEEEREYIFIPYWSFKEVIATNSKNSLLYFGLGVNNNGVDESDDGYRKIKDFIKLTNNASERILVVRMTDKFVNAQILDNRSAQQDIADKAVELAIENDFDGVLLDYETSAFGFESTTNNIYSFFELFSKEVKSSDLLFYVTLYGDNYFRARPYDIEKIGTLSDKVIIMAYDFSKSRGNPGPNFPLFDNNLYGYDFLTMVDDFQKDVDNEKLVVALGYFGYDWEVDSNGISTSNGIPLSTNEITQTYVKDCEFEECVFRRNAESKEPTVSYKDEDGNEHVVWFEDAQSVNKKKEALKEKGILETASWAYSYY